MRPIVRAVAAAFVLVAAALAFTLGAAAQTQQPTAVVAAVDAASSEVEVSVISTDYSTRASDVGLTEAGEAVEGLAVTTARSTNRPTEIVYVLDLDNRMMADGNMANIAASILESVNSLPGEVEIGLVSAGRQAEVQTRLTTDRSRFRTDLQALSADQGSALYDGVALAGNLFSNRAGVVRTVVLISGGQDTASTATVTGVESPLIQRGAQLVWVPNGAVDEGLDAVVSVTGGQTVLSTEDGSTVEAAATALDIAVDRLLVSFDGSTESGSRGEVTLAIQGLNVDFSYPAGLTTTNPIQLTPGVSSDRSALSFFGQPIVLYISSLLAFFALAAALWSLGSMFAGGESSLDRALARYSKRDETLEDEEVQEMLVQTALIQRAVDFTETFAERRGFLSRTEDLLERANIPVRAGEGLFFLAAVVVVTFGLAAVATGSFFAGFILAIVAGGAVYAFVGFKARRRLNQFESQLPDALQLLAGTLRAGYSMPQGLAAVSTEIDDPMGQELRRAITEAQLGREIEDALAGIADRLDSADFAWAVMAIGIQREVGGNLSELLLTVSETMIQRERLHREVNALTAEGRVSAGILSFLPPVMGFVMWVMNPDYIEVLFSRTIGLVMLGAAVISGLVGLVWMKKVITIDV